MRLGLDGKRVVYSSIYDESVNKYKAKCGASLEEWENSGWIVEQDPYGWFMWYCRYYLGRYLLCFNLNSVSVG